MSAIILYGSVARGDANDESDIDIAIAIKRDGQSDKKSVLLAERQIWTFVMREFFRCGYTGREYGKMGKNLSILSEYSEGGDCSMESGLKMQNILCRR